MTKPRLVKVRALLYVFQHVIKKRLAYFDTASSYYDVIVFSYIMPPIKARRLLIISNIHG